MENESSSAKQPENQQLQVKNSSIAELSQKVEENQTQEQPPQNSIINDQCNSQNAIESASNEKLTANDSVHPTQPIILTPQGSPNLPLKKSSQGSRPINGQITSNNSNHEIEWFRFENKIRFIIDSLMVPLHQTTKEMKESNDIMKQTTSKVEAQVTDFSFHMKMFDQKLRMFEELHRRLLHVEDKVVIYESRGDTMQKSFQNLTHQNNSFVQTVNDRLAVFEKQLDMDNLYNYMQTNLDKFKEGLFKDYLANEVKRDTAVQDFQKRFFHLDEKFSPIFSKAKATNEYIEKEFQAISNHTLQIEKIEDKLEKLKKQVKDSVAKLKKEENMDEMDLSERIDHMHKTVTRMVGGLRSEIFGIVPTKKDTEAMIKSQIEAIQIKIKSLEPQNLHKTIELPEVKLPQTFRLQQPIENKSKETINSSKKAPQSRREAHVMSESSQRYSQKPPEQQVDRKQGPQQNKSYRSRENHDSGSRSKNQNKLDTPDRSKHISPQQNDYFKKSSHYERHDSSMRQNTFNNKVGVLNHQYEDDRNRRNDEQTRSKDRKTQKDRYNQDNRQSYDTVQVENNPRLSQKKKMQILTSDNELQSEGGHNNQLKMRKHVKLIDSQEDHHLSATGQSQLRSGGDADLLDAHVRESFDQRLVAEQRRMILERDEPPSAINIGRSQTNREEIESQSEDQSPKRRSSPTAKKNHIRKSRVESLQQDQDDDDDDGLSHSITDSEKLIKRTHTRQFKNQRTKKKIRVANSEESYYEDLEVEEGPENEELYDNRSPKKRVYDDEVTSEFISDHSFDNSQNSNYKKEIAKFNERRRNRRFPVKDSQPGSPQAQPQIIRMETQPFDDSELKFGLNQLKKMIAGVQKQLEDKIDIIQKEQDSFMIHSKVKQKSIDQRFEEIDHRLDSRLSTLETHDQINRENLDKFVHRLQKLIFDTENISKEHEQMYRKALKEVQIVRNNNDAAMEMISLSQECLNIMCQLIMQDEQDRQTLALVGSKTLGAQEASVMQNVNKSLAQPKKYIELDPQCLGCSSNPMDIKNMFKLACLSYNPSHINYRDNQFEREAMIQMMNIISEETLQLQQTSIKRQKEDSHQRIIDRAIFETKEWQNLQQQLKKKQTANKRDRSQTERKQFELTQQAFQKVISSGHQLPIVQQNIHDPLRASSNLTNMLQKVTSEVPATDLSGIKRKAGGSRLGHSMDRTPSINLLLKISGTNLPQISPISEMSLTTTNLNQDSTRRHRDRDTLFTPLQPREQSFQTPTNIPTNESFALAETQQLKMIRRQREKMQAVAKA